jgi:argininosuccinate lyase
LAQIGRDLTQGKKLWSEEDEDIHTTIERLLTESLGPLAGKLHTGRSRNDQVATDLRLWLMDNLPALDEAVVGLQQALLDRAQSDLEILMPGYTHLQAAQPILLGHWWLSHFWPLQRDRVRLRAVMQSASLMPLGSSALAGVPYPIDREHLAVELGFDGPTLNSLDGVADRDFVAEFLFAASLIGVHLSRLAEAAVLFSTREFGFFEQADAYSTGSSIMPQKKNPDVFELARGKAGTLVGALTGLLTTMKGLPSAYDRDLQEDKLPLFGAYYLLIELLPVLAGAVRALTLHPERMRAAITADMMATDAADYLVTKGVPFRQAHDVLGRAVQLAQTQNKPLSDLTMDELRELHPAFEPDVVYVFDPRQSVARRSSVGGTAPQAVAAQLAAARRALLENI